MYLHGQCTYLAYDAFDYGAGVTLNGLSGGTGWALPWDVQNAHTTLPGYQTNAGSLAFNGLQTLGIHGSGGRDYVTTGRRLNTLENGPFSDYVAQYNEGIGTETGDTLWVSFYFAKIRIWNLVRFTKCVFGLYYSKIGVGIMRFFRVGGERDGL